MTNKELIQRLLEFPLDGNVVDPQIDDVTFGVLESKKPKDEQVMYLIVLPKYSEE